MISDTQDGNITIVFGRRTRTSSCLGLKLQAQRKEDTIQMPE